MTLTSKKLLIPVAVAVLVGSLLLAALSQRGTATAGADASGSTPAAQAAERERKSDLLVTAQPISDLNTGRFVKDRADINAEGVKAKDAVPVPPGRSADNANVEALSGQGGGTTSLIAMAVQFNASCDWYAYALADGANDEVAARVIEQLPQWPAFRGNEAGARRQAIADAFSRDDADAFLGLVKAICPPDALAH